MYRKKFTKSVLSGLLAVSMVPCVATPIFAENTTNTNVKDSETQNLVRMNIQFVDESGTAVAGGDYFLPEGTNSYSVLKDRVPQGFEMTMEGDFVAEDGGSLTVNIKRIQTDVKMNIQFVDESGNAVAGGDYFVPKGNNSYSVLEQYVPEGYEMTAEGDFWAEADGSLTVNITKIIKHSKINVKFVDENGKDLGGGDYFVDPDGDGVANYSELPLPEGYKLITEGDFFVEDGGKYTIVLDKIVDGTVINVVYVDEAGNNLGGGDYRVDLDNDGVANYNELTLPEGYELITEGDFFVNDFEGKTNTITLRKITKGTKVHVMFVDEAGNDLGGGDYFIDEDGDGIANYNEFALPEGYALIVEGDFFVSDFEGKTTTITLQKIVKETIINVIYVDEEGNVIGGGDFSVDPDGDGIANYSELTLPEGYELITEGDFFVENGASYTITLRSTASKEEERAATLNVEVVDSDTREVLSKEVFTSADKGQADKTYTFVYGEDYQVNIPKGYKLIKDVEPADINVKFGSTMTVAFYVTKDKGTESTENGNKEDGKKTDGVNTGVATAFSASMAGVAASGIGIVSLLRKKRNKR